LATVHAVPEVFRPIRELRAERATASRQTVVGLCLFLSFFVMFGDHLGFLDQLMSNRKPLLKGVVVPCAVLGLVLSDRGRLARSRIQIRLLFLFGLMGASLAWSWNPHDTFFSLQAFVLPMLLVITVLGAYDRGRVMRLLPKVAAVFIAFQFLDSFLVPATHGGYLDSAKEIFQPGWHGSFQHKNIFGVTLAMCICILLALETNAKIRRVAIPAAVFLVFASRSGTAMSTLLVPAMLPLIRNALRARNRRERSARIAVMSFGLSLGACLSGRRPHLECAGQGPLAHWTNGHLDSVDSGHCRKATFGLRLGRRVHELRHRTHLHHSASHQVPHAACTQCRSQSVAATRHRRSDFDVDHLHRADPIRHSAVCGWRLE
jgi:hypothetical protein